MRIMIIEDDQVIRRLLAKQILSWGYEIFTCQNFTDIMQEFDQINPHLVLLDINLPSYNGYYWCQEIRQSSKVPIIFISSRSDNMDQIMAMQMGADDFVVKPFDIPLLITKIQALLRRTYDFQINQSTQVILHGISLNLGKSQLESKSSKVDLTKTELVILYQLFQNHPNYLSRESLMEACWQGDDYIDENTLSVNISRLRKKLKKLGAESFIQTKKNVGYRIKEEG